MYRGLTPTMWWAHYIDVTVVDYIKCKIIVLHRGLTPHSVVGTLHPPLPLLRRTQLSLHPPIVVAKIFIQLNRRFLPSYSYLEDMFQYI